MSMIFIKGAPGAGKSYWAAYKLMRDEKVRQDYVVVHNLKDLNVGVVGHEYLYRYEDWGEELKKDGSNWEKILNQDCWEGRVACVKEMTGRSLLLIIDEAGDGLDSLKPRIKRFFSWHRHLGIDIWLIAQDREMIAKQYRNLCEYVITGNKSYVIDYFVYTYAIGRSKFRTEKLPKDEAVFGAYKSFDVGGASGKKSWLLRMFVILMVLGGGLLWYGMRSVGGLVGGGVGIDKGRERKGGRGIEEVKKDQNKKEMLKSRNKKILELDEWSVVSVCRGRVYVQGRDGLVKDLGSVVGGYNVANVDEFVTVVTEEGVRHLRGQIGLVKNGVESGKTKGVEKK